MGNEEPSSQPPTVIKAPTYQELFDLATGLQARLAILEQGKSTNPEVVSALTPTPSPAPQAGNDFRLLPDLGRSVPVFTGHESSCVADDWIGSVDALSNINNWPEAYRIQFAKSNLSNAARSWFLTEKFVGWTDFVYKFRAAFVRTLRMSDRWTAMCERVQGNTEHVTYYFYDKLQLCQALNLSIAETKDHIILGLASQELAVYAMSRTHGSPAALLTDLQEGGRLFALRRAQYAVSSPPSHKPRSEQPKSYKNYQNTPKSTMILVEIKPDRGAYAATSKTGTSTVRCYNCSGNGHIARDCPKPRKPCSACKSTSHIRSQCTAVAPPSTSGVQIMCAEVKQTAPNHNSFIKKIYFNDQPATCLIDSGSSHVLVRASLAKCTGIDVHWTTRPLYTVGDAFFPSVTTLGDYR